LGSDGIQIIWPGVIGFFSSPQYLVELWVQSISYPMDAEDSLSGNEDGQNMKFNVKLWLSGMSHVER
jgi:hypothetical protein